MNLTISLLAMAAVLPLIPNPASATEPSAVLGEPAHLEIRRALLRTKAFSASAIPLDGFVAEIADELSIPIWINAPELRAKKIDPSTPVDLKHAFYTM